MVDKKEIVLLEIPDRDYDAVTFVVRYIGFPNAGNERIQQRALGILPVSVGNPPIFPIYGQCIEWSHKGSDKLLGLPYGGRLEDYASTFERAVSKAYKIAKGWAIDRMDREQNVELVEYTRITRRTPSQENRDHWFWFQN